MTTTIRWASRLVAILLLAVAALVAVGVSIESASGHSESSETSEHSETGEGNEEPAAQPGLEGATLAGIPLESPLFIGGLAAISVVLAVAISLRPGRITGTLAILFSIAAGVFDVSEIQHQAGEGSPGLVAVAVIIVVFRVAAIVGSLVVIRERVRQLRAIAA